MGERHRACGQRPAQAADGVFYPTLLLGDGRVAEEWFHPERESPMKPASPPTLGQPTIELEFHFRSCSGLFRNLEVFGSLHSRQSGVETP